MINALAVSGTSVYVAGHFAGPTAAFGSTTLTNAGATNTADGFVAALTDAGNAGSFAWTQRAGGTGNDVINALAVSGTSVYVAGYFASPTAGFGPATLTSAGPAGTARVRGQAHGRGPHRRLCVGAGGRRHGQRLRRRVGRERRERVRGRTFSEPHGGLWPRHPDQCGLCRRVRGQAHGRGCYKRLCVGAAGRRYQ